MGRHRVRLSVFAVAICLSGLSFSACSLHNIHDGFNPADVRDQLDWLRTGRRVILASSLKRAADGNGDPTPREVVRQHAMSSKQAEDDASEALVQQAGGVSDVSATRGAKSHKAAPAAVEVPGPPGTGAGEADGEPSSGAGASLCGNGVCDPGESCTTCARDCTRTNGKPCQRVGIQYSVWHWPAWNAMRAKSMDLGKHVDSIETVLRTQIPGGKNRNFSNILYEDKLERLAMNFHFQHIPADDGPYCIYHRRKKGDRNFNADHEGSYQGYFGQPDCKGYRKTLARHAKQLVAAGIDHVIVDMTNMPFYTPTADAIQLRPFEVLVEEWSRLRAKGVQTPDIAPWQRLPGKGLTSDEKAPENLMWTYVLRLMNAAEYRHMWLRDPDTAKKVFVYPAVPDVEMHYVRMVESNWGLDNIVAQPMWISQEDQWSFMSLCREKCFISDEPCNQRHSKYTVGKGVRGAQLAVSPSYQMSYSSEAFMSVGTWAGHTLRKQFYTAFDVQPSWLFISSWNEHIAQAVPGALGKAMGFSADSSIGMLGFVDTYASAFGRDIEPTLEDGSLLYDIMASCLRVYRTGGKHCDSPTHAQELCCTGGTWSQSFRYLTLNDASPYELIVGAYAASVKPQADRQPLYNCSSSAAGDSTRRHLHGIGAPPPAAGSGAGGSRRQMQERKPKAGAAARSGSRTLSAAAGFDATPWFLSRDAKCEGSGKSATRIAYVATWKGSDFLRTLSRCVNSSGDRSQYTLGNGCAAPGYTNEKALGYVR